MRPYMVRLVGRPIDLSLIEYRIFCFLSAKPYKPYTRRQIVDTISSPKAQVTTETIDTRDKPTLDLGPLPLVDHVDQGLEGVGIQEIEGPGDEALQVSMTGVGAAMCTLSTRKQERAPWFRPVSGGPSSPRRTGNTFSSSATRKS